MTLDDYKDLVKSFGLDFYSDSELEKEPDGGFGEGDRFHAVCGFRTTQKYTEEDLKSNWCTKEQYRNGWNEGSLILYKVDMGVYDDGKWTDNKEKARKMLNQRLKLLKQIKINEELKKIESDF
jgi:hypothetical protein